MPVRVAILTRRSTDAKHQPFSIEAQEAKLQAYVQLQDGWQLVRSYSDDMTGATLDRPGLQAALRDARAGRYDVLLVWRVDRVARTLRGLLEVLDELEQAGVAFRSVTEHFDTQTPVGRMLIQILGAFAEFERASIIERVIAGMERKAARGAWCGGYRPFGYAVDKSTGYLVPKPGEAELVPIIFDLYANQRMGAKTVARWLNQQGYRTRQGRPWSHPSVLTLLRNRAYVGEIYFRGTWHPAPHPPLVDRDLFDAAQALTVERGDTPSKRAATATDYLLAGRIVCQRCGKHYVGTAAHGNRYRYRYYTCFSRNRYGTGTCPADRLPADQLEQALLDALLATYQHTDLFHRAAQAAHRSATSLRAQHERELAATTTQLANAEAAVERYLDAFEAGTLPQAQCGPRVQALAARIAELQARRDQLHDALAALTAEPPGQEDLADCARRVREALTQGDPAARKALVQALVHEVTVESRDRIVPVFRLPAGSQPPTGTNVRARSGSVGVTGLEPVTSSL